MKLYKKENQIKSLNRIVIIKDDMQTFNPTEEMVLADGWEEWIAPELTPEQILSNAKADKKREIDDYDTSHNVNEFYLNGEPMWFDKSMRGDLRFRFEAELKAEKENTVLWHNGHEHVLSLSDAMQMLYSLEVYASECYDNTQRHLIAIRSVDNMDDLAAYDYTAGYPEKLRFDYEREL